MSERVVRSDAKIVRDNMNRIGGSKPTALDVTRDLVQLFPRSRRPMHRGTQVGRGLTKGSEGGVQPGEEVAGMTAVVMTSVEVSVCAKVSTCRSCTGK